MIRRCLRLKCDWRRGVADERAREKKRNDPLAPCSPLPKPSRARAAAALATRRSRSRKVSVLPVVLQLSAGCSAALSHCPYSRRKEKKEPRGICSSFGPSHTTAGGGEGSAAGSAAAAAPLSRRLTGVALGGGGSSTRLPACLRAQRKAG